MKRELACLYVILAFLPVIAFMKSPEIGLVLAWGLLFCGLILMSIVISFGLTVKRMRHNHRSDRTELSSHQVCVHLMMWFILTGVVCIEIAVRKVGGLWGNHWFVAFHLSLVAAMTVTFIIARFRHNGLQSPEKHRKIVYPFALFYTASFVTGTMLIIEHFEKV